MLAVHEVDPAATPRRRVAFVITRSDAVGGAQMHVFALVRALAAAGHDAAVFVGGHGPFVDMLREAGLEVRPIPSLVNAFRPAADLRAIAELRQALQGWAPDLVSCHSSKAGWWGRAVARSLGVPSVHTVHGWVLVPGVRPKLWHRAVQAFEFASARLTEHVIAVSEYDRRVALQHHLVPDHKLVVIHNSIEGSAPRSKPGVDPPRVVMTARLEAPKDPLTVVAALEQLREIPWTLELIGDGPMRAAVEAAVDAASLGERITLLGTRSDVAQRLAAAQVFLLASAREGFPICILEAMRAGLPVVASDVGGISEAVVAGTTGTVVPPGDAGALASGLEPLLRDPALRERQGAAGRRRFESTFAFERHLARIWAVYADAMGCAR